MIGFLILIIFLFGILLFKYRKSQIKDGLLLWSKVRSIDCINNISSECDNLNVKISIPPVYNRPNKGFDKDAALYGMRAIFGFITSINNNSLLKIDNMSPPILSYYANDNQPITSTWYSGNVALVVIRGTRNINELKSDLKYSSVTTLDNYSVHKGMYSVYQNIKQQLFNSLSDSVTDVFIVGHSLGSAISYYFGLDLSKKYNVEIMAFAPPRSGDRAFTNAVSNLRTTSIINIADFIPSLPWSFMPIMANNPVEYSHVNPIYSFNNMQNDIVSCHNLFAYYQGITLVIPSIIPDIL